MTDKSTHDHDPELEGVGDVAEPTPAQTQPSAAAAPQADPQAEDGYVWHNALLQDRGLQNFLQEQNITLPPKPEGPEYEALLEDLKNNGYAAYAARLRAARFQPKAVRSTVIGQTVGKATDRSNAREKARQQRALTKDERGTPVQRKFNPVPWLIGGALLLAGTGLAVMLWPRQPAQAVANQQVCEAPNVLNAQGACVPIVAPTGPAIPANPNAEEAGAGGTNPQEEGTTASSDGTKPQDGAQPTGSLDDTATQTRKLQEAYESGRAAGQSEGRSAAAQEANDAARAAYDSGRQAGLSEGQSLGAAAARTSPAPAPSSARTVPAPAPIPTPSQPIILSRPSSATTPNPARTPSAVPTVASGPTAGGAAGTVPPPTAVAGSTSPPPMVGRLSVSTPAGGSGAARTAPGLTTATNRGASSGAGGSGGQTSATPPARLTFAQSATPDGAARQSASQGHLSVSENAIPASSATLAGSQGGGGAGGTGSGNALGSAGGSRSAPGLTMIRAQGASTPASGAPTLPSPVSAEAAAGQMAGALTFKGQNGVQPNVGAASGAAGGAGTPSAAEGAEGAAQASPYGPYRPFQTLKATLESAPVVIEQVDTSDLPVIARSEDGRKWVGYPTTSGPNRMIIRFIGYVDDDNRTLVPVTAASYDLSGAPGLQASSQDLAPDFVRNLVRRSATSVRDYANAALSAKETVVTGNTVITTPKEPNIWTTVAGSALGVFDLPADQRTFYRGAYLPVGTPLIIMVGASQKLNAPGR